MIGSHLLSVLVAAGDTAHASDHGHHSAHFPVALPTEGLGYAGLVLALPLIAMILNGVYAISGVRSKLPAWTTVACLGSAFAVVLNLYLKADIEHPVVVPLFEWINLSWGTGAVSAPFGLYLDSLTLLWMLFVTGLGTLIALYASEYMESDVGPAYCRFFGGVSIFLLAMGCLVMGDNLLTLYLGWEGVGFASYMLIGYHFTKPSAVAAAKKAFIVNRIGDLGLALGIYLTWLHFGTLEYSKLFEMLQADGAMAAAQQAMAGGWEVAIIPFLLMAGAFGKSAQLPFYVWLPDAMEGPTPVSALIHAATMVTAGVYLLVRTFPMLELHPAAAPTVAWVGGRNRIAGGHHWHGPVRHQACDGLFHRFPTGVHVHGRRRAFDVWRGCPRLHPRVLQSGALLDVRGHHARLCGPTRPSGAAWSPACQRMAHCGVDNVLRLAVLGRIPHHFFGLLVQGCHPRRGFCQRASHSRWTGIAHGRSDGVLHLPGVVPGVLRTQA